MRGKVCSNTLTIHELRAAFQEEVVSVNDKAEYVKFKESGLTISTESLRSTFKYLDLIINLNKTEILDKIYNLDTLDYQIIMVRDLDHFHRVMKCKKKNKYKEVVRLDDIQTKLTYCYANGIPVKPTMINQISEDIQESFDKWLNMPKTNKDIEASSKSVKLEYAYYKYIFENCKKL